MVLGYDVAKISADCLVSGCNHVEWFIFAMICDVFLFSFRFISLVKLFMQPAVFDLVNKHLQSGVIHRQ